MKLPKQLFKKIVFSLIPSLVLLLVIEGGLRLADIGPSGYFNFLLPAEKGLYPANASIQNDWGQIPYTIHTNNLGLRTTGNLQVPPKGRAKRIALIGDSVTEGFFVSDSSSYPYILQQDLNDFYPNKYEVLNCGKGGISIDVELAIFKEIALELSPDAVVLTFTTNDVEAMKYIDNQLLTNTSLEQFRTSQSTIHKLFLWLITKRYL